ncbi:hypothetical protein CBR_g46884 [Chara braunii]|uniref:Uncharacterized protein n=1 Tax=Chara braunii TaxID=69332 RepID=A0A388M158_CHABU|nr:hypothetical protein CBR_g46884 [Chara braunii]|eukprot:GBG88317.1 hypothetical protein CBR_g46884 [Chara braunii]
MESHRQTQREQALKKVREEKYINLGGWKLRLGRFGQTAPPLLKVWTFLTADTHEGVGNGVTEVAIIIATTLAV